MPAKYDPRVRTGSLEPLKGPDGKIRHWPDGSVRYRAQLRWPNGKRPRKNVPREYCYSKERAAEYVRALQEQIDAGNFGSVVVPTAPTPPGESMRQWVDRYSASLAARDVVTSADIKARLVNYACKHFGHKRPADVTRSDIEALVRDLDAKVLQRRREGGRAGISWKTGQNIWSDVVRAFDESRSSKDETLRVVERSPCDDVRGPDGGIARSQPFLRPAEVKALLECADVPVRRRVLYAVAFFTALRQGELRALMPADVDFDAAQIRVAKQARKNKGEAKQRTKSGRARFVSIEPNLEPLLRWLVDHPMGPGGRLLHVPPAEDCANLLRRDLEVAKCTREELTADDEQRAPIRFHSLRHTTGTHMAVRLDAPFTVMWRLGHATPDVTERYIAEARQAAGPRFGTPLAPLPEGFWTHLSQLTEPAHSPPKSATTLRPQRELNPCYRRERPVS